MTTDEAHEALILFAREYARTSGDGPNCRCTSCRAVRALRVIDGEPEPPSLAEQIASAPSTAGYPYGRPSRLQQWLTGRR